MCALLRRLLLACVLAGCVAFALAAESADRSPASPSSQSWLAGVRARLGQWSWAPSPWFVWDAISGTWASWMSWGPVSWVRRGTSDAAVVFGADETYTPQALQGIAAIRAAFAAKSQQGPAIYFVHPRGMDSCMLRLVRETGAQLVRSKTISTEKGGGDPRMLKLETLSHPIFRRHSCVRWFDADTYIDPRKLLSRIQSGSALSCSAVGRSRTGPAMFVRHQYHLKPVIYTVLGDDKVESFDAKYGDYPLARSSTFVVVPKRLPPVAHIRSKIDSILEEYPAPALAHGGMTVLPFLVPREAIAQDSNRVLDLAGAHFANNFNAIANTPRRQSCNPGVSDVDAFIEIACVNQHLSSKVIAKLKETMHQTDLQKHPTPRNAQCLSKLRNFQMCHTEARRLLEDCKENHLTGLQASKHYQVEPICMRLWQSNREVLNVTAVKSLIDRRTARWSDLNTTYGWYRFAPPNAPASNSTK